MEGDHELNVLAGQAGETSPNANNNLRSVVVKMSFFSKRLAALKHSLPTVKRAFSSLTDPVCLFYSTWATNWWALELLSWLSAAWALSMIILTLSLHQDKPLPRWPLDITMNSLLSVLSQIGQWGVMGSVAKAIGQLKWLWFARPKSPKRPLKDFVAFDEASRGPLGSFFLLLKGCLMYELRLLKKGVIQSANLISRHWVSLGALIVIVTQAFQPIVQQAVTYPIRLQPSGLSTVTRGVSFREVDGLNFNSRFVPESK